MHPQLQAVVDEFGGARERLHRLMATVPAERWAQRPSPERWSAGECVAHLNLTSRAYLPLLREALDRARTAGGAPPARFRRDLFGWLLSRAVQPGKGFRVKTTPAFVPDGDQAAAELVAEFDRLQDAQVEFVRQADGLPIHAVKMGSPFAAGVRYSVYSAFTILPAHQHRHLLQAERAWQTLSGK